MSKMFIATLTCATALCSSALAVEAKLYGQVNKSLFAVNDSTNTDIVVLDNILSSTRFGFKGEQKLDNGLTASFMLEGEQASNASSSFTQNTTAGESSTPLSNTPAFTTRHANVGLTGAYGGLYLGQLGTATDSVLITTDLAGASDVMSAEYRLIGAGLKFQKSDGTGLSTFTLGNLTETQYINRTSAVRYNSPAWNGLSAKAAIAQGGDTDAALFYEGTLGEFKLKGTAGVYFNNDATTGTNVADVKYLATASAKHSSGLGATVAYTTASYAEKTAGAETPTALYAKLGYAWSTYEVAVDAGQTEHYQSATAADNTLTTYGLAAQANLGSGVSVGALYRNYDADVTATATKSVDMYGMNLRVKF